ncbi:MAG: Ig-like domain-containing protein [Zhengella sp.]|uniref:DUF4347 domain-containing protein n=1 Tax=Zhengella sp. TaxID=2282762 RepID=UPI0035291206
MAGKRIPAKTQRGTEGTRTPRPGIAMPEALEPRVLLDAAMVETAADLARDVSHDGAPAHDAGDIAELAAALAAPVQETQTQVYFVDAGIGSADALLAALPEGAEVHTLDTSSDGVATIASVLEGRSGIDAIHILSHGRPGELTLGNAVLNEASIAGDHADELATIGAALSADADILIYGCDFAADLTGASAVEALARATGADIAASDDLTGASSLGGDWVLERQSGTVEAASLAATAFEGVLVDTDGDGVDDATDIDRDGDGVLDIHEGTVPDPLPASPVQDGAAVFNSATVGNPVSYTWTSALGEVKLTYVMSDTLFTDPWIDMTADLPLQDGGIFRAGHFTFTFTEPVVDFSLDFFHMSRDQEYVHNFSIAPDSVNLDQDGDGASHNWAAGYDETNPAYYDNGVLYALGANNEFTTSNDVSRLTWNGPLTELSFSIAQNASAEFNQTYITAAFAIAGGSVEVPADTDGDGIINLRDTDSDKDGITDNVEIQTTAGYVPPSGIDADMDGLDDAYDQDTTSADPLLSVGLTPVDTDSDGTPDFLDTDSDNDGTPDIAERGDGAPTTATDTTDTDQDGLYDIFEGADANDGPLPYDENIDGSGNFALEGAPALAADGSNAVPMTMDLLFRDMPQAVVLTPTTTVTAVAGTTLNVDLLATASDPEGDTFAITGIYDPADPATLIALAVDTPVTLASGTRVTLKSDGTLDVLKPSGSPAAEAIQYQVTDSTGQVSSATMRAIFDADGDGVDDATDIDDDNDGILDTVENVDGVSSATFDGSASVALQDNNVHGLYFSNDGMTMFVIGRQSDQVHQYSLTTAYKPSDGITHQGGHSIIAQDTNATDVAFSSDGLRMYVIGDTSDSVHQYTLENAFDLTAGTITFDGSFSVAAEELSPTSVRFSNDGMRMYVAGFRQDMVFQYALTTAFDITGGVTLEGASAAFTADELDISGFTFNADGSRIYIVGTSSDTVFAYTLATPFDVRSPWTKVGSFAIGSQDNQPTGLFLDPDSANLVTIGNTFDRVAAFSLPDVLGADGTPASLDLDSDDDGITDNVEAQGTANYTAPSGVDSDGNGLDDAYESTPGAGEGLTPVDTDGDGFADFLDSDSDGDGNLDINERGDGQATSLTSTADTDGDGLFDIFEGADANDGFDANDENISDLGVFALAGVAGLNPDGSNATPLTADLNFRTFTANNPPVLPPAGASVPVTEGTAVTGNVLTGASDPDGNPVTVGSFTIAGDPATYNPGETAAISGIGAIRINANGNYVFVPDVNYSGPVPAITFVATDGIGGNTPGTLQFADITPVNDAPVIDLDVADVTTNPGGFALINLVTESADQATGLIGDGTSWTANWELNRTAFTGYAPAMDTFTRNDGTIVGVIARAQDDLAGGDSYTVDFTATPAAGSAVDAVIAGGTSGINSSPGNYTLTWTGGGHAILSDPDGQIDNFNDGDIILSGDVLHLAVATDTASWAVEVPGDNVTVSYASDGGAETTGEDILFRVIGHGTGTSGTFTEGAAPLLGPQADAIVSSQGDNDLTQLQITVSNRLNGAEEQVSIGGHVFDLGTTTTVNAVDIGGSQVDIAFNATSSIFTITNTAGATTPIPDADLTALLRTVTYENTSDNPLGTVRNITFRATDADGLVSNEARFRVAMAAVNDAPVIDLDADDSTPATGMPVGIAVTGNDGTTATGTMGDSATWGADYSVTLTGSTGYAPGFLAVAETGGIYVQASNDGAVGNDTYSFDFQATAQANSLVDSVVVAGRAGVETSEGTYTLTWTGGGSAVLSDPDGQISNFADGDAIHSGDTLIFAVSVNPATWSVTVEGDNVSVDYASTKAPDNESANEQLSFRVNGRAAGASSTFTEDGGPVSIADSDTAVSDLGESDITKLTIVASGTADGAAEQVVIGGQTVDLSQNATLNGITVGGTQVDIAYDAATGSFTVTNTVGATTPMAVADLDTLIAGMTYENTSQDPTAGARAFAFTVTDAGGLTSNTATASVTVVPVNDAPTGTADPVSVTEDTPAGPVNVLANLSDAEGDTITIASATIDTNGDGTPDALTLGTATPITDAGGNAIGTITVAADGNVTFVPASNYDGAVPDLTYTPTDGTDNGAPVTVSFGTVIGVNDAPVAVADGPVTAVPGVAVNVDPLANDTDADGDTLTLTHIIDRADPGKQIALTVGTPVTLASGTTVTLKADGTLDFVMAQGVNDLEPIDYVVSDGNGGTGTGTITLARDSDGDGVANTDDIDDDNDGILDTVEYGTPAASPFYYAGVGELAVQTTPSEVIIHSTTGVGASATYRDALSFQGRSIDVVYTVVSQPVDQEYVFRTDLPGATLPTVDGKEQDYVFRLDFFEAGTTTPAAINFGTTIVDLDLPGGLAVAWDQIAAYHTRPTETITTQENPDEVRFVSTSTPDGPSVLLIGQAGRTSFTFTYIKEFSGSDIIVRAPTDVGFVVPLAADTDSDGIADYLDLDSDNDGITDNVEAQETAGYIAPSGVDADGNGLDDAYESTPGAGEGLTPVDTDSDGTADFIDADSDGDGTADIAERGDGAPTSVTATTDTDGDGLLDIFEGADANDGFDANDENMDGSGNFALEGVPALNADGSNAVPLTTDLLFRDTNDAPVTVADTIPVTEDTTAGPVNVLANDTDADGDTITIASATMDTNGDGTPDALTLGTATPITDAGGNAIGTITVTADGNVTFVPALNYTGAVPNLTYVATDGTVNSAPGTVSFGPITAVNDAPVMNLDPNNDSGTPGDTTDDGADDGGFETTFTEQGPRLTIVDSDFTISDPEDDIMEVVITLTNGLVGDMFFMPGSMPGGIIPSVVPSTPLAADGTVTITLTGEATTTSADWATVIKGIEFIPSATNPENPDPADRTITIQATDSALATTATLTTTIHVIPVNDAPTLDLDDDNGSGAVGGHYNGAYTENGAPAAISGGVLISDFDDTMLEGATIRLTNGFAGDQLTVGTLPAGISLAGAAPGSLTSAGTITIELTGSATLADYQAAIAAITYSSVSENPDTTTRDITVSVTDGELSSAVRSASITVTAVNDAPAGSIADLPVTEDTEATANVLDGVTDAEGDTVTVASASIDLDGDGTPDALTLGTPSDIVDAGGNPVGTIRVDENGAVSFTPAANYIGPVPDLTVVPTDGTDDGAPLTMKFGTITPVDDNPFIDLDGDDSSGASGTGFAGTFTEGLQGGTPLQDATDLVISDIDGVGIASLTVEFDGTFPDSGHEKLYPMNRTTTSAIFTQGGSTFDVNMLVEGTNYRFQFDGTGTVTISNAADGQSLTEAQARTALDILRYGNTSQAPTEGDRSFKITVTDTRGFTAQATASISVAGVNDAAQLSLDADNSTGATNSATIVERSDVSGSAGSLTGSLPDGTGFTVTGASVTVTGTAPVENPNFTDAYADSLTEMRLGAENQPAIISFNGGIIPEGTFLVLKDVDGAERVTLIDANGQTPAIVEQTDRYLGAVTLDIPYDAATGELSGLGSPSGFQSDQLIVFDISGMQDLQITAQSGLFFQFAIMGTVPEALNASATFTEDGGPVAIADSDATLSDLGEADITSLTVVASGIADGASEQVTIAGQTVDLSQDASLNGITVGGMQVDVAYVAATGTFTVTNAAGATTPMASADLSAIIAGMTYENTSQNPTEGTRGFAFSVTDSAGQESNTAAASISVVAVNDAPVAQDDALATDEDTGFSGNVFDDNGNGADIDVDLDTFTVTRVTGGTDKAALAALADGDNVGSAIAGSGGGTFTLNDDGSISFDPGADFNDLDTGESRTTSIVYQIDDGNGGTATAVATMTVAGVTEPMAVSGTSANSNGTLTATGTGEPGATIEVTYPDGSTESTTVAANGTWSVTSVAPQTSGNLSVKQTDSQGNVDGPDTEPYTDTTAPLDPTGVTATPNADGTLSVSGKGEPGSEVTVTFPDGTTGTATVDGNGDWGPVTSTAPQTSGDVTASQQDEAGNVSGTGRLGVIMPPLGNAPRSDAGAPDGTQGLTGFGDNGSTNDGAAATPLADDMSVAGTLRWIDELGETYSVSGDGLGFDVGQEHGGSVSLSLGDGTQGVEISTIGRDGRTYLLLDQTGGSQGEWRITGPDGGEIPAWVTRLGSDQAMILWPAGTSEVSLEIRIRFGDGQELVVPVDVDRISGEVVQTAAARFAMDTGASIEDRMAYLSNRAANETARLLQALKG